MRSPRHVGILRQHIADVTDSTPAVVKLNPVQHQGGSADKIERPHKRRGQTHQDCLKRQRRAQRQAKQVICDSDAYLAMFRDLWEFLNIPGYEDIAWF